MTRLFNCPKIAEKFAHAIVPGSFSEGFEEAIKQATVKRFLRLVLFLDQAKTFEILPKKECLFLSSTEIKASRTMLDSFSEKLLKGEGNFNKHLGFLGYTVQQQQTAIHEYQFGVERLAVDLTDGIRLNGPNPSVRGTMSLSAISRSHFPTVVRCSTSSTTTVRGWSIPT